MHQINWPGAIAFAALVAVGLLIGYLIASRG
jgi:hypothetical protein